MPLLLWVFFTDRHKLHFKAKTASINIVAKMHQFWCLWCRATERTIFALCWFFLLALWNQAHLLHVIPSVLKHFYNRNFYPMFPPVYIEICILLKFILIKFPPVLYHLFTVFNCILFWPLIININCSIYFSSLFYIRLLYCTLLIFYWTFSSLVELQSVG